MTLAASTGAAALGSIGLGGLALILATWFVLGTRKKASNKLEPKPALTLGLVAGVVWASAGQIWGVPNDLIARAVMSTQKTHELGNIGLGAISIVLVIVAYCVNFRPRAAGYVGLVMATTFSMTGGMWAALTRMIGDMATGYVS